MCMPETGDTSSFLCPNGTIFNQQYFVCDWFVLLVLIISDNLTFLVSGGITWTVPSSPPSPT